MAELQGFIFKTQALHLYRSFLRAIRGAPAEAQGKAFLSVNFLSKANNTVLHVLELQPDGLSCSACHVCRHLCLKSVYSMQRTS